MSPIHTRHVDVLSTASDDFAPAAAASGSFTQAAQSPVTSCYSATAAAAAGGNASRGSSVMSGGRAAMQFATVPSNGSVVSPHSAAAFPISTGSRVCSPVSLHSLSATEDRRHANTPGEEDLSAAAAVATAHGAHNSPHQSHLVLQRSHDQGEGGRRSTSEAVPLTNASVCVARSATPPPANLTYGATAAAAAAPANASVDSLSFASADGYPPRGASAARPAADPSHVMTAGGVAGEHPLVRLLCAAPRMLATVLLPSLIAFRDRVRHMTVKQILWVVLLVALVMVGNFMQIVMLNFWLISFPADGTPGNYTAFAVPGIFFAILFVLLLGAYTVIRRPSLRFARHAHGWAILTGVGFCDAFNSWLATYAASYTSEVLQALFTNLCPLFAVFLCKWLLRDTRRYANPYIVAVFVLTICGILAASLYGMIKDHNVGEGNWWILIFFLSMPFRVLMNVLQSLYMIVYTRDPKFVPWLRVRLATEEADEAARAVAAVEHTPGTTATATPNASNAFMRMEDDVMNGDLMGTTGEEPPLVKKVGHGLHCRHGRDAAAAAPMGGLEEDSEEGEGAGAGCGSRCRWGKPKRAAGMEPHGPVTTADGQSDNAGEVDTDDAPRDTDAMPHHTVAAARDAASAGVTPGEPVASLAGDVVGRGNEGDVEGRDHFDDDDDDGDLSPTAAAAPPLPTQTMFTVRYNQGEDTVVKLVMLAGETTIQMCFTLSLLPADALPRWGNSATVSATWGNFVEGIRCVFTIRENFLYCFLYTLGFVFTYVGCAYLNHYSAALCSIVSQLSSPVTALMLVIVPSWNVQVDGDSPWYYSVIAIVFLSVAALLYVMWEEMTDDEKVHAEYELKMRELHVRPSSHETPHPVTIEG